MDKLVFSASLTFEYKSHFDGQVGWANQHMSLTYLLCAYNQEDGAAPVPLEILVKKKYDLPYM